jgi:hypothetical protein
MLDNPYQTARLLSKFEDALPLPAFATPELQAAFRQQGTGAEVTSDIRVTEVHYLGDSGGIMCRLAFDTDAETGTFNRVDHASQVRSPAQAFARDRQLSETPGQAATLRIRAR